MRIIAKKSPGPRRFSIVPRGPKRFYKALEPLKEFMVSHVAEGFHAETEDFEIYLPLDWNKVEVIKEIEPGYIQLLDKEGSAVGSLFSKPVPFVDWPED